MARAVPDEAVGAVVGVVAEEVPVADDVPDADDDADDVPDAVVEVVPEVVAVDVAFEAAWEVEASARAANAPARTRPAAPTTAVNDRTRRALRYRPDGEGMGTPCSVMAPLCGTSLGTAWVPAVGRL